MANVTWRELKEAIDNMPLDRLDDTATVLDGDEKEFLPIEGIDTVDSLDDDLQGVLDEGHMVVTINNWS